MPKRGKFSKPELTPVLNSKQGNTVWEVALSRAELALSKNKAQRARLRTAIRFFQDKIQKGEPWPVP